MKKKMWHCKNCGNLCDTANGVCPECGLDLGFYGEVQFVEMGDDAAPPPPPQPQPQPQQQQAAPPPPPPPPPPEPQQVKPEKQKKVKEPKPPKEGGKGSKLPIIGGAVALALIVVLVIGGFALRTSVDGIRIHTIEGWETSDSGSVYYVETSARKTQEIDVRYKGFLGTQPELKVTSSDSDVVQVSAASGGDDGAYTVTLWAKSPGTAKITARAGDQSNSYQIQVYQITGVELSVPEFSDEINLSLGDSVSYTAGMQYEGTIGKKQLSNITVTSSDPSVVEVSASSNQLIARGGGSAVITASAGGYDESVAVSVFEVTGIEMDCYDLLTDASGNTMYWLPVGLAMGVDFVYHYNGEMGSALPSYTLESSDEKVLSVDPENFIVTAVSAGSATITATMAGHSDSVTLDVYPVDRSSGAWVRGSLKTIAAPTSGGSTKKDYTVTIRFGDGVSSVSVPTYYGAGGSDTQTKAWEDVSDQYPNESKQVHSRDLRITLRGSSWDQKRNIAGITFLFKRTDSENSKYDPATDIVDYWVIYTE